MEQAGSPEIDNMLLQIKKGLSPSIDEGLSDNKNENVKNFSYSEEKVSKSRVLEEKASAFP